MPTTEIQRTEIYKMIDGIPSLVESFETEVEIPTQEEIITDKEAEMLAMYEEIQRLKQI